MIKKQKGFTLVELMVTIAIIGLLTSIVMVNFNKARSRARDGKRIADIATIQLVLEHYYDRCGNYPPNIDTNDITGIGTCPQGIYLGTFIAKMPTPPLPVSTYGGSNLDTPIGTSGTYVYRYGVNDNYTQYVLAAQLENDNDVLRDDIDGTPSYSAQNGLYPTFNDNVTNVPINCEDNTGSYCVGLN